MNDITITRDKIFSILQEEGINMVSIYLPTHTNGVEVSEGKDTLRLKNLISRAHNLLSQKGVEKSEIENRLDKVRDLLEDVDFWNHQKRGLALFIGVDYLEYIKLPYSVDEEVYVGPGFYIKPLVPMMNLDRDYYILAIDKKKCRLFRADTFEIIELDLQSQVSTNIEEAIKYDVPEKSLQHHKGDATGDGTMYHGQGSSKDSEEEHRMRFYRLINEGVNNLIEDKQKPLVLAGTENEVGTYKKVSNYQALMQEWVNVQPNAIGLEVLHDRAHKVAQSYVKEKQDLALHELRNSVNTAKSTVDTEAIVKAGIHSAIDKLFIFNDSADVYGYYNAEKEVVNIVGEEETNTHGIPLINHSLRKTLLNGGEAYIIPSDERQSDKYEAMALLRYDIQ